MSPLRFWKATPPMASLKSALPAFAKALQVNPAALYERQRALVRAELLEMKPGHGPGSGVLATPHSIAMLLIAVAATGSLTETGGANPAFANLKSNDKKCPLTGKRTFVAAFTAILDLGC